MKVVYAVAVGALAALAAGPGRADDKKDEKDYAKAIVGKWEITKAGGQAQAGTTLDFAKGGKLKMVIVVGDMKLDGEGTYTVEKDKLTAKFNVGGQDGEEVLTIKKLTADAMELEDKAGGVDVLKRVKETKKD